MSNCELWVEMDEAGRRYRSGESVTGRVRVRIDGEGEVLCKKLLIEQVWRTHGRGNGDQAAFHEHSHPDQRWLPGQVYEVPFSFPVPAAPVHHHGHLVNVDHYIAASADLPWKVDPRAAADYLVVAGPGTPDRYVEIEADFEKASQLALQEKTKGKKRSVGGVIATIVLSPLWIALLVLVLGLLLALLPILLVVALVRWIFLLTRQSSAERKLGKVDVAMNARKLGELVEPHSAVTVSGGFSALKRRFRRLGGTSYLVTLGTPVTVAMRFTPKSDVTIDGAELVISATESTRSGSGTNSTTHTHLLTRLDAQLSGPRTLSAGQPIDLHGEILLPADAAPSFSASNNKVTWEMKLAISIPQWPDWVQTNKLLVVPGLEQVSSP